MGIVPVLHGTPTAPHGCVVVRSNLPIGANYNWTLRRVLHPRPPRRIRWR